MFGIIQVNGQNPVVFICFVQFYIKMKLDFD